MADEDLKKRLLEHSKAFEGLMDLVPAEYYYGKDNSDQWQRKKQTKEEKRAAKKAKLEPGAYKSALDVHKEREREHLKRKRELEGEPVDAIQISAQEEKTVEDKPPKKQKLDNETKKALREERRKALDPEKNEAIRLEKANKRREQNRRRKDAKREEKQRQKDKRKAKTEKTSEVGHTDVQSQDTKAQNHKRESSIPTNNHKTSAKQGKQSASQQNVKGQGLATSHDTEADDSQSSAEDDDASSVGSSPEQETLFDNSTNHSSASSSSSIIPPSEQSALEKKPEKPGELGITEQQGDDQVSLSEAAADESDLESPESSRLGDQITIPIEPGCEDVSQPKTEHGGDDASRSTPGEPLKPNSTYTSAQDGSQPVDSSKDPAATDEMPKIDREALTKRLSEKLAAYRAARKADGPDGKPAKNRAELLEARRRKVEVRKQRKKEQRAKDREAKDAETEAARLRGGNGSPIWSPSMYSPGGALAKKSEPNLQFGRVAFEDGAEVDGANGTVKGGKKKKGPSDTKTALIAAEKKQARVAGLDPAKRADIEEKDAWAHARQRVAGEKRKDDPSLLKKALKRKEKLKGKSEKAWNERLGGVRKSQEMRQKKREDNIRKRKDEKGIKGKDRKKLLGKPKGKGGSQKKRPGFEGSFKSSAKRA